jgi:hypothetical protein
MTNLQTSGLPQGVGGKSTSALSHAHRSTKQDAGRIAGAIGSSSSRITRASRDDILVENEARTKRNEARADRRATTTEDVKDDEEMLTVPTEDTLPEPRAINTDTPMINLFRGYNALTPGSRTGFEALVQKVMDASAAAKAQPVAGASAATSSVAAPPLAYDDAEVKYFDSIDDAFEIPRVIINLAKSHSRALDAFNTISLSKNSHRPIVRQDAQRNDPRRSEEDGTGRSGFPC